MGLNIIYFVAYYQEYGLPINADINVNMNIVKINKFNMKKILSLIAILSLPILIYSQGLPPGPDTNDPDESVNAPIDSMIPYLLGACILIGSVSIYRNKKYSK